MKKSFIALVQEERDRQLFHEGFTKNHDDTYKGGKLARAAAIYATPADWRNVVNIPDTAPMFWPWDATWWRPTPDDRQRELIKAAALLHAEWDRLERLKQ